MKTLTAFSILIICSALQAQPQKTTADKIVAIIGDRIILQSEISDYTNNIKQQSNIFSANTECSLLEQAFISKLMALQAEKDSIVVADEEVEIRWDQQLRYFIKQLGDLKTVEEYAGKPIQQLKEESEPFLRERILIEAIRDRIVRNIKITPSETKAYFERIPKDSLTYLESAFEIGQIIFYPETSSVMEHYVQTELNNYKRQVEGKVIDFKSAAKSYSEEEQYELIIYRNDKNWDANFLTAVFRLKEEEISVPLKSGKNNWFLVKMIERRGNDATVQIIRKAPPVTTTDINDAIAFLESVRQSIISGKINFNEAALKFSNDDMTKFSSFILDQEGAPYITINQLDQDVAMIVTGMKTGEYSHPKSFINQEGKKGVRFFYLKSLSEPHIMNFKDDYNKISRAALEEKKAMVLDKWIKEKLFDNLITVDRKILEECPGIKKYKGISALDN